MKTAVTIIVFALLAAGCERRPSPEEKARSDAADVALVEAAQQKHPPVEPITLQSITSADMQLGSLAGAGCFFVPHAAVAGAPVLVTLPQRAVFKLDGKLHVAAADPGSARLSYGTRTDYDARKYSLRFLEVGDDARESSGNSEDWTGYLIVSDQFERPVFSTAGRLECRSEDVKFPERR